MKWNTQIFTCLFKFSRWIHLYDPSPSQKQNISTTLEVFFMAIPSVPLSACSMKQLLAPFPNPRLDLFLYSVIHMEWWHGSSFKPGFLCLVCSCELCYCIIECSNSLFFFSLFWILFHRMYTSQFAVDSHTVAGHLGCIQFKLLWIKLS